MTPIEEKKGELEKRKGKFGEKARGKDQRKKNDHPKESPRPPSTVRQTDGNTSRTEGQQQNEGGRKKREKNSRCQTCLSKVEWGGVGGKNG